MGHRQLYYIITFIVFTISLIVLGFTIYEVNQQRESLVNDVRYRSELLADSLKELTKTSYLCNDTSTLQNLLNKFTDKERLFGLAVYDNEGKLFAFSDSLPQSDMTNLELPANAMDANRGEDSFTEINNEKIYIFVKPIHQEEKVVGALAVFQRTGYIDNTLAQIWKTNLLRLFLQIFLFSISIIFVIYLFIYKPVLNVVKTMRGVQNGFYNDTFKSHKKSVFLEPITAEITKMANSLVFARIAASEEARMRLEKIDSPWTGERLKEFIKSNLKDRQIFIVSNSEPYVHMNSKSGIIWQMPASGMVTALEPVVEVCGGTWIAHGRGDADKLTVDANDKIQVPPDEPKYILKRVWLNDDEIRGYYNGFSNEALWPLCLMAHNRPLFRKQDWVTYCDVNKKFSEKLLFEIKDVQKPIILVQDYHLAVLPKMIKDSRPDVEVGLFWHIPWPSAETFGICPWRKEILEGMTGADIIGFHIQQFCNNFLDTINKEIESIVNWEEFSIARNDHFTYVKPFPLGIDFVSENYKSFGFVTNPLDELKIKTKYLGVGVDRLDYTKGILEKLKGLEFFFDTYPEYKGQFTFVQIAPPSRTGVKKYIQFGEEVKLETERINKKFESDGWKPLVFLNKYYTHEEIYPLYAKAQFCLITSLSDGMNMVAKEYIASKNDESGVLILSKFAGAAKELKSALVINPYSAEKTAEAIHQSITMPLSEQKSRMKKMRDTIKSYNVYCWAAEFLKAISNLS